MYISFQGPIGREGDGYRKLQKEEVQRMIVSVKKKNHTYSVIDAIYKS